MVSNGMSHATNVTYGNARMEKDPTDHDGFFDEICTTFAAFQDRNSKKSPMGTLAHNRWFSRCNLGQQANDFRSINTSDANRQQDNFMPKCQAIAAET
jgi:hypothetical protein